MEEWKLSSPSTKHTKSWQLQRTGRQISPGWEATAQDVSDGSCCCSQKRKRKDSSKSSCVISAAVIPNLVKLQLDLNTSTGTQEKTLTSEVGEILAMHCSMLWQVSWSFLSVLVCTGDRWWRNHCCLKWSYQSRNSLLDKVRKARKFIT